MKNPDEVVAFSEFARRLDCDESTVRRYVREGKIYASAVAYKPTGKVPPRADVCRELCERGTEVRTRFEMIPDWVTDRLLAADTRAAALDILQAEFADVLAFTGAAIARPLQAGRERR